MKKSKKLLSLFLSLVMLISAVAGLELTANAYTATSGGYKMTVGESLTITDDNMTNGTGYYKNWYSNNTSVASVSSTGNKTARVTAKNTGTCTITCCTQSWVTTTVYNPITKKFETNSNETTTYHYWEIKVENVTTTTTTKAAETTTLNTTSGTNSNPVQNASDSSVTTQQDNNTVTANSVTKPKKTSINKLTKGKKQFKASWKKVSGVSGYQLQYATDKKFKKNKKTVTIKKSKTTAKTVKKLKSKKTYYVRVRTYKTVNGKKVYSSWSKVKSVKVK